MIDIESENLEREWAEDPYAPELFNGLEQLENDTSAGMSSLNSLAEAGSALAMMHLGYISLSGEYGVEQDFDAGEAWMRRSAEHGSIEGAYRLANLLLANGHVDESLELFKDLSRRGYGPASFILGLEFYRGHYFSQNLSNSIEYLNLAAIRGHLHAKHWLSFILMKGDCGIFSWFRGLFIRLSMIAPLIHLKLSRPGSDRLRIWI